MVILIAGGTHTGKTVLAQYLLEKYNFPYLSIDHLKMGLIRSGKTKIGVDEDKRLTRYLWPIVREIIKTNIENKQNIIIEGCYIPFIWKKDFTPAELKKINYLCLIMSEEYINKNFSKIVKYENKIEKRKFKGDVDKQKLIEENNLNLKMCKKFACPYILIDKDFNTDLKY